MKLSELLKRLEAIKAEFGDLPEIDVMIGEDFAALDRLEVEERTTLILVAEDSDSVGSIWED